MQKQLVRTMEVLLKVKASVYLLISKSPRVLSPVALCMGWRRHIRVRDTVLNAEAVSKDYGGFVETESKCLPEILSPVAFCIGGWRVRDTVLNAESVS